MTITWKPFEFSHALKAHEIHLITANLSDDPSLVEKYWQCLAHDERQRANQFRFNQHRSHYIMARGILRHILGCYTNVSACSVEFDYEPQGKPQLKSNSHHIQFNLSHSAGMALYGLSFDAKIGVDIEQLKTCNELELAKRFFAYEEYLALTDLPAEARQRGFFHIWTQKEAFIKALGSGLFQALNEFTVSATGPGQLISSNISGEHIAPWHLQTFEIGQLQAAFATKQPINNVYYWQWIN